jgi:hypothetical protein
VSCDGGRARALQQTRNVEGKDTAPGSVLIVFLKTTHTDHLHWSLQQTRNVEGKDPATKPQIRRSAEWHHTEQRLKPIPNSRIPIPILPPGTCHGR